MHTNKEVEWRRFIVPKKVKQINDHILITTSWNIETQSMLHAIERTVNININICCIELK